MSKILSKTKSVVKSVGAKTTKCAEAMALGVIGPAVGAGVHAKHSMDDKIEAFADSFAMALIATSSLSSFSEKMNLHNHQQSCKNGRNGFDWAMLAAHSDNQQQYGG